MRRIVLALTLAASLATAAPAGLFDPLWRLLTSTWNETGCYIDPGGRCAPGTVDAAPPTTDGDTGCNVDPNGRCAS